MKIADASTAIETIGAKELPQRLRSLREIVGLNQLELAKLSRVPQSNIHRIESGKQRVTPRTFARIMSAIEKAAAKQKSESEELKNELERLRGIAAARARVAFCSKLPWMRSQLPNAQKELADRLAEAEEKTDSLSDPIVRGLLQSYEREVEALDEALKVFSDVYGQTAGKFAMRILDAFLSGDERIKAEYDEWKRTGNTDLKLVIDNIEKVETGDK